MSGRTAGRVSGYPVWQQTPVLSRSVARRARERGKQRARGGRGRKGREEGRYGRSFVNVAARTGNTKYGRHLVFSFEHERAFEVYFFHGKSKFLCSSGRRALGQTPRLDSTFAQAFSGETLEHYSNELYSCNFRIFILREFFTLYAYVDIKFFFFFFC